MEGSQEVYSRVMEDYVLSSYSCSLKQENCRTVDPRVSCLDSKCERPYFVRSV